MSFDALAWAAKQSPGSSGTKLVLLGLAECANRSHGLAFPSIAELVAFTCLDRKSVIANLDRLEAAGYITDTGRKVGRTGQIKVYQLHLNGPENGIPKTEPLKANGTEIPSKGPESGTRNLSEPLSEAKASSLRVISAWNEMAKRTGLPESKVHDASFNQSMRLRLKSNGEAQLIEAIGVIGGNPWLQGKGRESSWRPNLGWLLKPANLRNVLERTHGQDAPAKPRSSPAEEIARLDGLAIWFREHNRPDDAVETARKADRLRAAMAGEPVGVGSVALRVVGGMGA